MGKWGKKESKGGTERGMKYFHISKIMAYLIRKNLTLK